MRCRFCLRGRVRLETGGRQHLPSLLRSLQKPRAFPPLIPAGGRHSKQRRPADQAKCGISFPFVPDPISSCAVVLAPGKEVRRRRRRQLQGRGPLLTPNLTPRQSRRGWSREARACQIVRRRRAASATKWDQWRRGKEAPPLAESASRRCSVRNNGQRRLVRPSNGAAWKKGRERRWGLGSGLGWTGASQS